MIGRITTLYGTMDGAYNWWETLNAEMSDLGYYHLKADPSVHSRHADGNVTIMSTYTDDTMEISSSHEEAECQGMSLGTCYLVYIFRSPIYSGFQNCPNVCALFKDSNIVLQ